MMLHSVALMKDGPALLTADGHSTADYVKELALPRACCLASESATRFFEENDVDRTPKHFY